MDHDGTHTSALAPLNIDVTRLEQEKGQLETACTKEEALNRVIAHVTTNSDPFSAVGAEEPNQWRGRSKPQQECALS